MQGLQEPRDRRQGVVGEEGGLERGVGDAVDGVPAHSEPRVRVDVLEAHVAEQARVPASRGARALGLEPLPLEQGLDLGAERRPVLGGAGLDELVDEPHLHREPRRRVLGLAREDLPRGVRRCGRLLVDWREEPDRREERDVVRFRRPAGPCSVGTATRGKKPPTLASAKLKRGSSRTGQQL